MYFQERTEEMKRKFFSIVLSVCMILSCVSPALAAESSNISAGNVVLEEEIPDNHVGCRHKGL